MTKRNDFKKMKRELAEISKGKYALEENISCLTTKQRHGVAKVRGYSHWGNSVCVTHTNHRKPKLPGVVGICLR